MCALAFSTVILLLCEITNFSSPFCKCVWVYVCVCECVWECLCLCVSVCVAAVVFQT